MRKPYLNDSKTTCFTIVKVSECELSTFTYVKQLAFKRLSLVVNVNEKIKKFIDAKPRTVTPFQPQREFYPPRLHRVVQADSI